MTGYWRSLRGRVLTPDVSETLLSVRGFHVKSPQARDLLETVGSSFLTGFGHAAKARDAAEAEAGLEQVPERFRGFAYEGAAMGFAVRDGLPFGRHDHVERFLRGRAGAHVYMAYIGVGWAMARVPRLRWKVLTAAAPDPLLRWLVLDGYGFHQAYFHTDRYVRQQYQEPDFPWPAQDPAGYARRAIDQGIGRAMWFVGGTDAALVADMIDAFPAGRRADLYSGAGLAATYAGGADKAELELFWERAGEHRALVAQASAFAATARVQAGLLVPHTELATAVFCDVTPAEAEQICAECIPVPTVDTDEAPAFEVWRRRIAERFTAHAGSSR